MLCSARAQRHSRFEMEISCRSVAQAGTARLRGRSLVQSEVDLGQPAAIDDEAMLLFGFLYECRAFWLYSSILCCDNII